jgi:putative SOS response-associated peptidase YedK
MCGRFTDRYTWREIKELYDLTTPYLASNFPPRTNIAPMQKSFVVRLAKDGGRELAELKWGLVPSWSKDDTGAARMINARAETVARLPTFRAAFKARPCLVVADGF